MLPGDQPCGHQRNNVIAPRPRKALSGRLDRPFAVARPGALFAPFLPRRQPDESPGNGSLDQSRPNSLLTNNWPRHALLIRLLLARPTTLPPAIHTRGGCLRWWDRSEPVSKTAADHGGQPLPCPPGPASPKAHGITRRTAAAGRRVNRQDEQARGGGGVLATLQSAGDGTRPPGHRARQGRDSSRGGPNSRVALGGSPETIVSPVA